MDSGGGTLTTRMPASGKNVWVDTHVSDTGLRYMLTIVEEAAVGDLLNRNDTRQYR